MSELPGLCRRWWPEHDTGVNHMMRESPSAMSQAMWTNTAQAAEHEVNLKWMNRQEHQHTNMREPGAHLGPMGGRRRRRLLQCCRTAECPRCGRHGPYVRDQPAQQPLHPALRLTQYPEAFELCSRTPMPAPVASAPGAGVTPLLMCLLWRRIPILPIWLACVVFGRSRPEIANCDR